MIKVNQTGTKRPKKYQPGDLVISTQGNQVALVIQDLNSIQISVAILRYLKDDITPLDRGKSLIIVEWFKEGCMLFDGEVTIKNV